MWSRGRIWSREASPSPSKNTEPGGVVSRLGVCSVLLQMRIPEQDCQPRAAQDIPQGDGEEVAQEEIGNGQGAEVHPGLLGQLEVLGIPHRQKPGGDVVHVRHAVLKAAEDEVANRDKSSHEAARRVLGGEGQQDPQAHQEITENPQPKAA